MMDINIKHIFNKMKHKPHLTEAECTASAGNDDSRWTEFWKIFFQNFKTNTIKHFK